MLQPSHLTPSRLLTLVSPPKDASKKARTDEVEEYAEQEEGDYDEEEADPGLDAWIFSSEGPMDDESILAGLEMPPESTRVLRLDSLNWGSNAVALRDIRRVLGPDRTGNAEVSEVAEHSPDTMKEILEVSRTHCGFYPVATTTIIAQ